VIAAAASWLGSSSGAPRDAVELAQALGEASGAVVDPNDVRWEPSGGLVSDLLVGRFAIFLASDAPNAPRDVWRARVRLSPEGRPIDVSGLHNLTSTPLGDDHALVVRGAHAAFATFAYGQEQSVTALDLGGEGGRNSTTAAADRAMAWVTNVQQTGAGEGIGRVDVTLDQPARRVGLVLSDATLEIDLADDDRARHATRIAKLDLDKGEMLGTSPGMHAEPSKHLPKKLSHWAVDTVRAVPWIGPAPIAWLEEKTFGARDTLRQLSFKLSGGGNEALAATDGPSATPPPTVLDASQASADLGHWPPSPIRSIWKTPEAGEGEWTTPKQSFLKKLPGDAPSPFYLSYVRPDEERPYSKVLLVAMDMRQLDLDMEAGSEDPKPLTGPPGTGRLPRDPAINTRVAAAFNGGFKTEHGAYGMMLKKRVLLPPMAGIATVIITKDQRVGMGSWGTNKDVGGLVDIDPSEIVSMRQNLDPLIDNDKVNPLGRAQWGFTLPGTGMQTERSGICITSAGHMMYAWGDDVNANALGKAMKMAGCIYGMHLDMNPYHTGFIFTNITDIKSKGGYQSELLSKQMEISPDRYIQYAPKDFFYVTLHDPTPPALEGIAWSSDPGVQPAPSFMPGLWHGDGANVELLEIEPSRASFRVRAGTKEPETKTGAMKAHELSDDDAHRVLFALTLGAADTKRHRGLVTEGRIALPMSGGENMAALVAERDGDIAIVPLRDYKKEPAGGDAVELPLLLDDGKPVPHGHVREAAALGLAPSGRVLVARAKGSASLDDSIAALKRAGCKQAVLLDRGIGDAGRVFRAGTATPPRSRYEETVLYAMGKPLLPRGFRFESAHPVEPAKKK
jgi:hypothetical protein